MLRVYIAWVECVQGPEFVYTTKTKDLSEWRKKVADGEARSFRNELE